MNEVTEKATLTETVNAIKEEVVGLSNLIDCLDEKLFGNRIAKKEMKISDAETNTKSTILEVMVITRKCRDRVESMLREF